MSQNTFREFLRTKGLKFTRGRSIIAREVSGLDTHFDIEGLYKILKSKRLRVSRASLYRTIPLLVESGLLVEIRTIDSHTHYENTLSKKHHDHLICLGCGTIIEFHSEFLERLQEKICLTEKFKGIRHVLEIQGYCRHCTPKAPPSATGLRA